jgi:hypothetical protein
VTGTGKRGHEGREEEEGEERGRGGERKVKRRGWERDRGRF